MENNAMNEEMKLYLKCFTKGVEQVADRYRKIFGENSVEIEVDFESADMFRNETNIYCKIKFFGYEEEKGICVEEYAPGPNLNYAFCEWKGRVIAEDIFLNIHGGKPFKFATRYLLNGWV